MASLSRTKLKTILTASRCQAEARKDTKSLYSNFVQKKSKRIEIRQKSKRSLKFSAAFVRFDAISEPASRHHHVGAEFGCGDIKIIFHFLTGASND